MPDSTRDVTGSSAIDEELEPAVFGNRRALPPRLHAMLNNTRDNTSSSTIDEEREAAKTSRASYEKEYLTYGNDTPRYRYIDKGYHADGQRNIVCFYSNIADFRAFKKSMLDETVEVASTPKPPAEEWRCRGECQISKAERCHFPANHGMDDLDHLPRT